MRDERKDTWRLLISKTAVKKLSYLRKLLQNFHSENTYTSQHYI